MCTLIGMSRSLLQLPENFRISESYCLLLQNQLSHDGVIPTVHLAIAELENHDNLKMNVLLFHWLISNEEVCCEQVPCVSICGCAEGVGAPGRRKSQLGQRFCPWRGPPGPRASQRPLRLLRERIGPSWRRRNRPAFLRELAVTGSWLQLGPNDSRNLRVEFQAAKSVTTLNQHTGVLNQMN
jgi:hypothetical protein